MHTRTRAVAALVTAGLLVASGIATATADTLQVDGDELANGPGDTLHMGDICAGRTATNEDPGIAMTVSLFVRRNGGPGAKYASSAVVTTTVASIAQSAAGGTVSSTNPADITLPSDWASLDNNSFASSPVVEPTVTVAASTTPGYASATITYRGTGTGANGGTLTRESDLLVDWTVVTGCDTTPPVITPNIVGTLGTNGWYTSDVALTWTVVDNESAISSSSGCGPSSVIADTTGTAFTCAATSAGGSTSVAVTIKRDATAPTVAFDQATPGDGATYPYGLVPAAPTCTANDATSGLTAAGCAVTGYSAAVGTHTITASATDMAGNVGSTARTYTVEPWTLHGFFAPVDMPDVWNSVKGGSTVPLKFRVFQGATELTDVTAIGGVVHHPPVGLRVRCSDRLHRGARHDRRNRAALRRDGRPVHPELEDAENCPTPATLATMTTADGTSSQRSSGSSSHHRLAVDGRHVSWMARDHRVSIADPTRTDQGGRRTPTASALPSTGLPRAGFVQSQEEATPHRRG